MGYDILTRVIELTDSDAELGDILKDTARLLIKDLKFDGCSIYEWDAETRSFTAAADEGIKTGLMSAYSEADGLIGLAWKKNAVVEAHDIKGGFLKRENISDKGLNGYKSATVAPLKDDSGWYGAIYLKALKNPRLPQKTKKLIHVIAKQLASTIKNDRNYKRLENTYNELKETQKRLVNAEKLMALGELSATLAHEIKTPLVSIGGFALRLKKKSDPASPTYPYIEHIVKGVERLEKIIMEILTFAEDRKPKFNREELNNLANDTITFFEECCQTNNINIVKKFMAGEIHIMADAGWLKIAFDNLLANAIESMDKGGTLTAATRKEKDWGIFEIKDTGGGIAPNLVSNIFNPFFTTKKSGTGLGLPVTNKIILRHRGIIDVINDYGQGMTFSVKIPLSK